MIRGGCRTVVSVVGAVLVFGTAAATDADFAQPPEPLPEARAGTVIRSDPIEAPAGAVAWRVLYHSRSIAGDDIAVSGVVVAPDGPAPAGGRPVVAYAHGTTGLADGCAPSARPDVARRLLWVEDFLAAGYVVAATDYEGLGPPGIHPYLVGESEGRAVLDSARSARALPTAANRDVVVVGHSQGGHAALFAGQIARRYAPDLSVRGVAPGAPVTDVAAFVDRAAETPGTLGFLVMGTLGYRAAYPELATTPMLSPAAQARSDIAVFGCANDVLTTFASDDADALYDVDPRTRPEWLRRMKENTPGRKRSVPVFVWQGTDDTLTPSELTEQFVDDACARGTTIRYSSYPDADHVTVLAAAHDDVLDFVATRFARQPVARDCAGPGRTAGASPGSSGK